MAHALKIDTVVFSSIIVHFDLANESVARHRERFGAKLLEAQEESARLNVRVVNLISENELTGSTEEGTPQSGRMIIEEWPEDYDPGRTSYDDFLDHEQIEMQAKEIIRCIINRRRALSAEASPEMSRELIRMRETLHEGIKRHSQESLQSSIDGQPAFRYCDYLYKKIFVGIEGQVYPCCSAHPARPILGNVHKQSVRAIWNGEAYWNFRNKFQSAEMPECCQKCSWVTSINSADILKELAV
jgi:radical SAM protein with 4Fe4S-binding SPASM domain